MAGMFCGRQFCSRQKGGDAVGKTKRGKGTKWMVVVDGQGIPLGSTLHSASPAEVTLVEGRWLSSLCHANMVGVRGRSPSA